MIYESGKDADISYEDHDSRGSCNGGIGVDLY
jgi:hypothetical protein